MRKKLVYLTLLMCVVCAEGQSMEAGKDKEILIFGNSLIDVDKSAAKKIIAILRNGTRDCCGGHGLIRNDAENFLNQKGQPSFTLTSPGMGEYKGPLNYTEIEYANVGKDATEVRLKYRGNGYVMILALTASNRFFTRDGTDFLGNLDKYKVGGNSLVYLDGSGRLITDQKIIEKFY